MEKFEVGDKVEVIEKYDNYKVGDVGIITSINEFYYRINGDDYGVLPHCFKKVEGDLYEDQWHLNDGKVTIPHDADKLEKDGSVVSFRKRKVKPFEFGERLRIKKSLWPDYVINPKNINPGLDYVDAVYIRNHYDIDKVKGIMVYINDGQNSWDCCLTSLDMVERLT